MSDSLRRAGLVAGLCAFVVCVAACAGGNSGSSSAAKKLDGPPKSDAAEVVGEFHIDQKAAVERYRGRTITIKAVVEYSQWKDSKNGPHVYFNLDPAVNGQVYCFFGRTQAAEVLALKKGDAAEIRGKFRGGAESSTADKSVVLILDDCELISPLPGPDDPPLPKAESEVERAKREKGKGKQ